MDDDIDFTQPWMHSDAVFVLEDRKIYANKTVLSMWSPVMHAMFSDDFKVNGYPFSRDLRHHETSDTLSN